MAKGPFLKKQINKTNKFKPPGRVSRRVCLCQMFQSVPAVISTMEKVQRFTFSHIWSNHRVTNVTAQSDIGVRLLNVKQVFPDVRLITLSSETDAKMQRRGVTDVLVAFSCAFLSFRFRTSVVSAGLRLKMGDGELNKLAAGKIKEMKMSVLIKLLLASDLYSSEPQRESSLKS